MVEPGAVACSKARCELTTARRRPLRASSTSTAPSRLPRAEAAARCNSSSVSTSPKDGARAGAEAGRFGPYGGTDHAASTNTQTHA
jgi:hypothetical protein